MKKLLITFVILLTLFIAQAVELYAVTVFGDIDYTVTNNYKYDLETGIRSYDTDYSSTNRVLIPLNNLDNKLYFEHTDFHHILFFSAHNTYLGYAIGSNTTLELPSFIDYITGSEISIPTNATKFALMTYNYYPDEIHENLEGLPLTEKPSKNLFDKENALIDWYYGGGGILTNVVGSYADEAYKPVIAGEIYISNHADATTMQVTEYDSNKDYISRSNVLKDIPFTINVGSSYIRISLFNTTTDINDWQYELGSISTTYEPYVSNSSWSDYNNLTYDDIFFNTNLVTEGEFSNGFTGWSDTSSANEEILNEQLHFTPINTNEFIQQTILINSYEVIYHSYDYKMPIFDNEVISVMDWRFSGGIIYNDSISHIIGVTYNTRSNIFIPTSDINTLFLGMANSLRTGELFIDNVEAYNLTTSFDSGLEPDIFTFETWKDIYEEFSPDPLISFYSVYYNPVDIIFLDVTYAYDDTPAPEPDAQNAIEANLSSLGVETTEAKIFMSFGIMAIVAVVIGIKTSSNTFIILAETILLIVFTLLGWFSFWILLLLVLIFVLLIFKSLIKGGE